MSSIYSDVPIFDELDDLYNTYCSNVFMKNTPVLDCIKKYLNITVDNNSFITIPIQDIDDDIPNKKKIFNDKRK
ncbi:Hypothetical protein SRAE_X000235600 [Strongyloides ratti]|uniref:Uncharacterized protein n=1 Tax=Strongyloides ratti TaxID=34506 RepID=A0A090KT82_STRRB|nr:Hypothetical protein SRAE_X000235600 [Strongyloides ratti]CEF60621.1 Hypothetical protein SRAE_X000235600 [Strongyloides ratti]